MCVWVFACVCEGVHKMCVHACGGPRLTLIASRGPFAAYSLKCIFPDWTQSSLTWWVWSTFWVLVLQGGSRLPGFLRACWGSELRSSHWGFVLWTISQPLHSIESSFPVPGSDPGCHTAFSCHISSELWSSSFFETLKLYWMSLASGCQFSHD